MGMKQITDSDGDPDVFGLGRRGDGLWLRGGWAPPDGGGGGKSGRFASCPYKSIHLRVGFGSGRARGGQASLNLKPFVSL